MNRVGVAVNWTHLEQAMRYPECHEGVTRRGEFGDEFQPCDKPAVAVRLDPTEWGPYPVCRRHVREPMVTLELLHQTAHPEARPATAQPDDQEAE